MLLITVLESLTKVSTLISKYKGILLTAVLIGAGAFGYSYIKDQKTSKQINELTKQIMVLDSQITELTKQKDVDHAAVIAAQAKLDVDKKISDQADIDAHNLPPKPIINTNFSPDCEKAINELTDNRDAREEILNKDIDALRVSLSDADLTIQAYVKETAEDNAIIAKFNAERALMDKSLVEIESKIADEQHRKKLWRNTALGEGATLLAIILIHVL
jgi:hypothetical protein